MSTHSAHKTEKATEEKTIGKGGLKQYLLLALAILLLVVSVVQAVQIDSIEDKVESGASGTAASTLGTPGAGAPAVAQRSTAPTMVGGC